MNTRRKEIIIDLISNVLVLPILCWPMWIYRFPFLYSDSGTYLIAFRQHQIPIDRPVMYSELVSRIANFSSVYAIPLFQSLLVLYVMYIFVHRGFKGKFIPGTSALIALLLAGTSGLPFLVNQIMPDLLTPLLFLIAWTLFKPKAKLGLHRLVFWIVFALITATHTTHLLLGLFAVAIAFMFQSDKRNKWSWNSLILGVLLSVFTLPLNNYRLSGRFYYSDSSRVFLTASLQTAGVLVPWLERHCGEGNAPLFLCTERSRLAEMSGNDILWNSDILIDSSCNAVGGWGFCWKQRNEELKAMASGWWKDRAVFRKWLGYAWGSTWQQSINFGVGMISSQKEGSAPYEVLKEAWPLDLARYKSSKQYTQDLYFHGASIRQMIAVIAGLFVIMFAFFVRKPALARLDDQNRLGFALFLFIVCNAAICGVFSNPLDRYEARVIWLIPLMAFLWLFLQLENYRLKKNENEHIHDGDDEPWLSLSMPRESDKTDQ
ncbi:MAG: hypothetical protein GC180_08080 [Bacteroidetes bacterium]|nr:hypothetical protein [Bacteroidota bacterium]